MHCLDLLSHNTTQLKLASAQKTRRRQQQGLPWTLHEWVTQLTTTNKATRAEVAPGQHCGGTAGIPPALKSGVTPGLKLLPAAASGCPQLPAWH